MALDPNRPLIILPADIQPARPVVRKGIQNGTVIGVARVSTGRSEGIAFDALTGLGWVVNAENQAEAVTVVNGQNLRIQFKWLADGSLSARTGQAGGFDFEVTIPVWEP